MLEWFWLGYTFDKLYGPRAVADTGIRIAIKYRIKVTLTRPEG
jgi:hypothetical protein